MGKTGTSGSGKRRELAAPGQERRVGVGMRKDTATRCKAKHDVPWSERCTKVILHAGKHEDKAGRTW